MKSAIQKYITILLYTILYYYITILYTILLYYYILYSTFEST